MEITSKKIPWVDIYRDNGVFLNALSKSENAIIFENICRTQRAPEKLRAILCQCCSWHKADRPTFSTVALDLSSISDIDLENINEGKAKSTGARPRTSNKRAPAKAAASLPVKVESSDLGDNVLNLMTEMNLSNPNPEKKPPTKRKPSGAKAQSATNVDKTDNSSTNQILFQGPRGGFYSIDSNGNKKYVKKDTN